MDRSGISFKLRSFWPRNKNKGRISCFFGVVGGFRDAGMAVLTVIWLAIAMWLITWIPVPRSGILENVLIPMDCLSITHCFFSLHGIEGE